MCRRRSVPEHDDRGSHDTVQVLTVQSIASPSQETYYLKKLETLRPKEATGLRHSHVAGHR